MWGLFFSQQGTKEAHHLLRNGFFLLWYGLGRHSFEFFPQYPAQNCFQFFSLGIFQNHLYQKGVFLAFRHSLQNFPCSAMFFILEVGAEHK